MVTKRIQAYPCAEITHLPALMSQTEIKDALLRETGGGEAFIERAAETLKVAIFQASAYRTEEQEAGLLHRLSRRYDNDQLARALARAWLNDEEHFFLPRVGWYSRLTGTLALAVYSIVFALMAIEALVAVLRHVDSRLAAEFVAFPPALAIIGWTIAILIFLILRKLFKAGD